jgi:hypothetical protein|tara:strand:+ start:533 stop:979 length:447 start_codon:yes stop_codon:yes gene_type:complete
MAGPGKYANGQYSLMNASKYAGNKVPYYRSGWEHAFMRFCDNHPSVVNWASEAIQIPYRNPLTGKQTIYVPDFFIVYQNKKGKRKAELIEIKPKKQTALTEKTSQRDRLAIAINHAKWEAAAKWCKLKGVQFRIVTEDDLFHQGNKRR